MIWFVFCVFCALFLNSSLATFLGFSAVTTTAFLPFTLLLLKEIFLKRLDLANNKQEFILLILGLLIVCFKFFIGQDYFKYILTLLIIPMLISVYLSTVSTYKLKSLRILVECFYVIECLIAFYEKLTKNVLFYNPFYDEYKLKFVVDYEFRSSALLGHPLSNAMVVAVMMTFIVINKKMSDIKKYIFLGLGLLGLLSFNSRGAILVISVFILPYFIYNQVKKQKMKHKPILLLAIGAVISVSLFFLLNSSLGGRLAANDKLIDGSAQTRLDVYKFYKFLSNDDLWYGNPDSYLYITEKLKAGGVENGIVVYILNFGLVLAPILLYFLFKFQYQKLKSYDKKERILILTVFYLIGVMNPNLAVAVQWMVFIFVFYGYESQNIENKIIESKINV